jgi:hypothetical protein
VLSATRIENRGVLQARNIARKSVELGTCIAPRPSREFFRLFVAHQKTK